MDQSPAVAFNAFADVWLRATETEIGAALCAIGARKDFGFDFDMFFQDQKSFDRVCFTALDHNHAS